MTLSQWHRRKGNRLAALAVATGISRGYLTNLAKGRRAPSLEVARKIAKATKGVVPVESWPAQVQREAA